MARRLSAFLIGNRKTSMKKRILRVCTIGAAIALIMIIISSIAINSAADGKVYSNVSDIPHNHVGLLLGCSRQLRNGKDNLFFEYRTQAAIDLFKGGKINYIIVSGDNSRRNYDESSDMKNALVEKGIPAERIYCDYAGFRTLDSIVRAKTIFRCSKITVISQEFHNRRAIYIANHKNIEAIGYNAREVNAYSSFKTKTRELLARTLTIMDILILNTKPKFAGDEVQIPGV